MDTVLLMLRRLFMWVWPVVVVFLAMTWAGSAYAQACPASAGSQSNFGTYPTQAQAYAACQADRATTDGRTYTGVIRRNVVCQQDGVRSYRLWGVNYSNTPPCNASGSSGYLGSTTLSYRWTNDCPADTAWDESLGICKPTSCPGGAIVMTNGLCSPKPEECLARNAEPGFANTGDTTRNFSSHCVGGCNFQVNGPHTATTHGGKTVVTGNFEFSGSVCGAAPSAPPQPDSDVKPAKDQECSPAGSGQTFCVKANGDQCASTSAGRQICWKPGETGEKTDKDTLQKRQPGETPTPPTTAPPDGDTWKQPKDPIKTVTESKSSTGTTNTTITTVITNTSTSSGVNAGKGNAGEKDDGSGEDKEGDGEGETGTYSADCAKPPACSSTDGIGCAILRQQWSNKCDAIQGDVNQIGSTTDISREGLDNSLIDVWDQGDGYIPGPTDVDTSGWAGRGSCPINIEFSAMGKSFNVNHPQLCEILDALAALILIVGSWHAGFILTTGFRKG